MNDLKGAFENKNAEKVHTRFQTEAAAKE